MALTRGQVIALSRHAAMVWVTNGSSVTVVPIGGYNGPPPHRAEVRFDDLRECLACGISIRYPVVRCHQAYEITLAAATSADILGHAPASLLTRCATAIKREADARALETRLHFNERRRPLAFVA